jgi:hypothetical protein
MSDRPPNAPFVSRYLVVLQEIIHREIVKQKDIGQQLERAAG